MTYIRHACGCERAYSRVTLRMRALRGQAPPRSWAPCADCTRLVEETSERLGIDLARCERRRRAVLDGAVER